MKRLREDSGGDMEAEGEEGVDGYSGAAAAVEQRPGFIGPQLPPRAGLSGDNFTAGDEGKELHNTFRDRARYIPLRWVLGGQSQMACCKSNKPCCPPCVRCLAACGGGRAWRCLTGVLDRIVETSLQQRLFYKSIPTSAFCLSAAWTWRSAGCCGC